MAPAPRDWFSKQFGETFDDKAREIGRFNLAIFGKTGVGKSTLVNAIFGEDVAETGIGQPVTQGSHLYLHADGHFGVLDTRGLEIGTDDATILDELETYIKDMRRQPQADQVHVAWYCVRAGDRRFEDTEEASSAASTGSGFRCSSCSPRCRCATGSTTPTRSPCVTPSPSATCR